MQWIENNKITLNVVSAIFAVTAVGAPVAFRSDEAADLERWQLGLVILPWMLFTISFLPLVYLSWFRRLQTSGVRVVAKAFFWMVAVGALAIFVMIYGIFVFGDQAGNGVGHD
jgi:hypothetical protein